MWIYDDPPSDEYEKKIRNFLETFLKNKEIAAKSARTLGLYKYLSEKNWKDSAEIYNSVYLDKEKKKHFFGKKDAKTIFTHLGQNGGAPAGYTAIGQPEKGDLKPYDALVMRSLGFAYYMTPDPVQSMINFVEPFAFPLRTIEDDIPIAGNMIGLSVDIAAAANKVIAKNLQQFPGAIFGLPGTIFGYMISTIFIFFNMAIYVSRKHLGEAYTQSFALIPLFGMSIQSALEAGDGVLEKVSEKRGKIINQVRESSPSLGNFLDFVIFDPDYQGDPAADAAAVKEQFSQITKNVSNELNKFKENIKSEEGRTTLLANTKTGIADLGNKVNEKVTAITNRPDVQNYVSRAKDTYASTNDELSKQVEKVRSSAAERTPLLKKGGKRLSKKARKKSKWRTRRKLKK
jgi:hypothetical protein